MSNIFSKFSLSHEKEDHQNIITSIDKGVVFRGTNLWILIFAIFVASLGLNVNSTAVIIGAMLISPLMDPIMGIGLGMGINDVLLLKKALHNYFIATIAALITSTIFFLISPLDDAHSEILARTCLAAALRRHGFRSGATAVQYCVAFRGTPDAHGVTRPVLDAVKNWNLYIGDGDLDRA